MMTKQIPGQMPAFLRSGVFQVCVVVENLDQTIRQYWEHFGIGPWLIYTFGPPLVRNLTYRGQPADHRFRLALATAGQMMYEVIEPLAGETIYADFIRDQGYGCHHIAFLVDDMETALAEAAAEGLAVLQSGSGFGVAGDGDYAYLDTTESFGMIVELVQRPSQMPPPDHVFPPAGA
jgi:methylmalonyl-CoA/ethylmalonyl-CoA epimerase